MLGKITRHNYLQPSNNNWKSRKDKLYGLDKITNTSDCTPTMRHKMEICNHTYTTSTYMMLLKCVRGSRLKLFSSNFSLKTPFLFSKQTEQLTFLRFNNVRIPSIYFKMRERITLLERLQNLTKL